MVAMWRGATSFCFMPDGFTCEFDFSRINKEFIYIKKLGKEK